MLPITDNENENFEILSDEIADIPELEALNSADRKMFEVFLEFWNVSVYPKFVMLAQQGSKDGAGKAVELVRRTKTVLALYNEKIGNYRARSSSDVAFELHSRYNNLYAYFESIAERRKKLNRAELDVFAENVAAFAAVLNPPKKMSRPATSDYNPSSSGQAAQFIKEQPVREPVPPAAERRPAQNFQQRHETPDEHEYRPPRPNYFRGGMPARHGANKNEPINLSIPIGIFCFFAGAGLGGPVGAAIGLAVGLLVASRSESGTHGLGAHKGPPPDEVLDELKNAESDESRRQPPPAHNAASLDETAAPRGDKKPDSGCCLGCFIMFFCMAMGNAAGGGGGMAAGLFMGFFLASLINDLMSGNYKDIEGGFTINGFFLGLLAGIYFEHPILGIIFGIFVSRALFSLMVNKR